MYSMKRLLNQVMLALAGVLAGSDLIAQDLVFSGSDFASWDHPAGLVTPTDDGVEVMRFGKTFNAVANADQFESVVIGDLYGSVRPARTPSNQADAHLIADQDPKTWWKPVADDPTENYWVELDLGRAVIADKIRVIFPDTTDARPFTFFSVFVSPGVRVAFGGGKRIVFNRIGRPVNNNSERVVEFQVAMDKDPAQKFAPVRFVRFEAAGRTPNAALAEIEVDGVGFNIASKVAIEKRIERGDEIWGGRTWTSDSRECSDRACGRGSGAEALIDEDLGFRMWNIEAVIESGDWRDSGYWGVLDFENVFRVDRVVWLPYVSGVGPYPYAHFSGGCGWRNQELFTSDGTVSKTAVPEVEGLFEYELLAADTGNKGIYDFQFPPRPVRLINWRVPNGRGNCRAIQWWIFHAEGYPARISIQSADLPLGGARSIRRVEWDADLPPGTRIEVQTQTGNDFQSITRYFLANGKEVTKEGYEAAKRRQRGDIVEEQVRDASWSTWSNPHRFSGQDFQSPTPRQWLQARVALISDDPDVFPRLRSLTFVASDPVISAGLSGVVLPREAALDSLMEFRYTIKPEAFSGADPGFDRVLIALPEGGAGAELVRATVGGAEVAATGVLQSDTLLVQLPPPLVRRDSVEITFATRLFESPTVFETFVFNSEQADNTQGVLPAVLGADQVFVPDAVAGGALVRNLVHNRVFTPNGDGANDLYRLSFTVVKTGKLPRARIFALDGSAVAELVNETPQGSQARYAWDGMVAGTAVPPGVYLLLIEMNTDATNEVVHKLVHVVY